MRWLPLPLALIVGVLVGYFLSPSGGQNDLDNRPSGSRQSSGEQAREFSGSGYSSDASSVPSAQAEPASIAVETFVKSLGEESTFEEYGTLHDILRNASSADLVALMDGSAAAGGSITENWNVLNLVAMRWAEVDPEGMYAYVSSQDGRYHWGMRNALFSAWARTDVNAALAAARQIENPRYRNHTFQAVLGVVAQDQPLLALEVLENDIGNSSNNTWVYQNVFSQWANRDPEAARQAALDLPDSQAKVSALTGALGEWVSRDALGALEWLDSLPNGSSSYYARRDVFRNIVRENFDAARAYVDSKQDPVVKRKILENIYMSNFAYNKGIDEMVEVFEWMSSVTTGQLYDRKVQDTIQNIAERDPELAKEFVAKMPLGNGRRNALGAIGSALAMKDPALALEFANTLEFEDERRQVLSNMGWRLARGDVEKASQMILASNDPLIEKQLGGSLVDEWSIYNREAALAFANSLSDPDAKSTALQRIVKHWMQSDPEATMAYLETEVTDENKQRNYLRNAFNDWSRQDPAEAAKWLENLPESTESFQPDLYRTVANAYLNHDPYAASEWIGTLDDGGVRDRAVQALVDNIHRTDPESAFIWAGTVSDDKQRKNSLERSVREWAKMDVDAAYEAVVDAKLEAAEKEPLFKLIEQERK